MMIQQSQPPPSTTPSTTFNATALLATTTNNPSLTIDEMRTLHRQALSEAERKKTELRLVLASRYRELVGSSDEVTTMEKDARVLQELVTSLPDLVQDLIQTCTSPTSSNNSTNSTHSEEEKVKSNNNDDDDDPNRKITPTTEINIVNQDRIQLSLLPRIIHSYLDQQNVHGATTALLQTFTIIGKYTTSFPLINQFLKNTTSTNTNNDKVGKTLLTPSSLSLMDQKLLYTQIKMIYLHLQSIPLHTIQLSKRILMQQYNSITTSNSSNSAHETAKALSALHRLDISLFQFNDSTRSNKLLDLYFESKAMLIRNLLDQLSSSSNNDHSNQQHDIYGDETYVAEKIISNIIYILQHDIILNPYQIFIVRKYNMTWNMNNHDDNKEEQGEEEEEGKEKMLLAPPHIHNQNDDYNKNVRLSVDDVMKTLPTFDREQVKIKASNFLAAHLPLIRAKVNTVLVGIAGTTASRLGSIRQSLYDKTDGFACIASLSSNGICTWDDAVQSMVDLRIIARALDGLSSTTSLLPSSSSNAYSSSSSSSSQRKFSLWSTLFSNTFSSLVHSILSTSFHSVHRQVVASLRASLANAPSFTKILPHEAYRNTLRIASELDAALKKVSDDAHELLVHAEEREESERRLRQSLYVQTCEIMGRLLNELRRMLITVNIDGNNNGNNEAKEDEDATKHLIIGRLCFLLKFRLTSLPKLLDPNSSPSVLSSRSGGKFGMITVAELQSAFEIADVDDDGLINFEEAMEAMDGAFSGTQFHGAEMVRETMLLASGSDEKVSSNVGARAAPKSLTLSELALLSARGLRHDSSGTCSSLGIIQKSLDDIIESCFCRWSTAALSPYSKSCMTSMSQFVAVASSSSDDEWKRLHKQSMLSEGEKLEERASSNSIQIGSVSSFIVSYIISVSTLLNKSTCPSDSLPPFPNNEYAIAMGFDSKGKELTMVDRLRCCLLRESFISIAKIFSSHILEGKSTGYQDINENNLVKNFCLSGLSQFLLDIKFTSNCFFKRNKYSFFVNGADHVASSREMLNEAESSLSILMKQNDIDHCLPVYHLRIAAVYKACDMFLSALLGDENESSVAKSSELEEESNNLTLILNPLPSSRRFALLPIQAEQSMKELQLLRNLEKERADKHESERMSGASVAANAVSSGIGYFSSLLKKK